MIRVRPLPGFLAALLELIVPERCRVCEVQIGNSEESAICADCLAQVSYLGTAACCRCGTPYTNSLSQHHYCGSCLQKPPSYNSAASLTDYAQPVSTLLQRLKYQADTTVLPALATIAETFDPESFADCSWIIPVPLHPKRLAGRGLNQALVLAELIFPARKDQILKRSLLRTRMTKPQTGLDGAARRNNLRSAFRLAEPNPLYGQRICLVDDVYTTGTTVEECSKTLLSAGVAEVRVITFSRVVLGWRGVQDK